MTADTPNRTIGQGFIPGAPAPAAMPDAEAETAGKAVLETPSMIKPASPQPVAAPISDQLARIEDKCSRIEDKHARAEALLTRVEDHVEGATNRMGEAARQSDLAALRTEVRGISDRVRGIPGTGALILTAIITSVLTVILMVAIQRLPLDSLLPQRAAPAAPAS